MTKLEAWKAWCATAGTGRLADQFTLENSSHGKAFSFAWDAAQADFKERLAQAIEQMPFGKDTTQSFAIFVRNFK